MKKLVIHPPLDERRLGLVQSVSGHLQIVNCQSSQQAIDEISDADGFYGKLTPALLSEARQLEWVQSPTASLEHYLFPELIAHPCQLSNMQGLFYDVIADQVFAYILMFARRMHIYMVQQTNRIWAPVGGEDARADFTVGPGNETSMDRNHQQLANSTLGVIGLGSIGSEIIRYGKRLGMRTVAVDPYASATEETDHFGDMSFLPTLLKESDFVVVAAPHTPETEGFFNATCFKQMKSSAFFINIGRGVIVPLDDLVEALESQQIAGAALDVYEIEPLPAEHPLWGFPNVILTPHIAACTPQVPERHLEVLLENIERFANGSSLLNVVNKTLWF